MLTQSTPALAQSTDSGKKSLSQETLRKRRTTGMVIAFSGGAAFIGSIAMTGPQSNRQERILLTPSMHPNYTEMRKEGRTLASAGTALHAYSFLAIGGGATYAFLNSNRDSPYTFAGSMMMLGGTATLLSGAMQHGPLVGMESPLTEQSTFASEAEFDDVLGRYKRRRQNGFILYGAGGALIVSGMVIGYADAIIQGNRYKKWRERQVSFVPDLRVSGSATTLGVQGTF